MNVRFCYLGAWMSRQRSSACYRVSDGAIGCKFVALHAPHTPCNEMRALATNPKIQRNSLSWQD
jgi:hypothetical protein